MTSVILGILTAGVIIITAKGGRSNTKQLIPVRVQKGKRSR